MPIMNTKTILTTLFLLLSAGLWAGPVSREQARQQAAQFLNSRGIRLAQQEPQQKARRAQSAADSNTAYYVFNAENGQGFVIVSGDDRTEAILGYTDNGTFDEANLPDGLKWMLQTYTEQMEQLDGLFAQYGNSGEQSATAVQRHRAARKARHSVEPLLTMTWNQGEPYNLLCPRYYNQDGTQGDLSATGCVATAIAQVIGYYRWPEKLKKAIPGYMQKYSTDQGEKSVRLNSVPANSVIDWDNMLDNYNNSETEAQKKAISELMLWVGMTCKMSYGPSSGSGFSEGIDGLVSYFDFDDGTHVSKRADYSIQAWDDLIYNEIATGHPVPYGGMNTGGGHAFVLDGYDVSGLYHVNWGWGGMSNGYFRIDILDPDNNSGIGASPTPGGYNMGQDAIIGMKRPDGEKADEKDTPQYRYRLSVDTWELKGTDRFAAHYVNWSGVSATWQMGVGYFNEEGQLTLIGSYNSAQLSQNYWVGIESVIRGLKQGTYHVVPVSKRSTDATWRTDVCPDVHYILVEVDEAGNVTKMEIRGENPPMKVTNVTLPGNHKKGDNQAVCATIRNTGDDELFKEIHLLASQTQNKGTAPCRTAVALKPGEEKTIALNFTPEQTGTWNIWLATDNQGNNVLEQTTMAITADGIASTQNLRYVSHTVNNRSNGTVYGSRMQGAVTVMNQGTEPYDGLLKLWLFKLASNGYYYGDQSVMVPIQADPRKTGRADYYFENLELNAYYVMSIIYEAGGDIQDGGLKQMGRTQAGIVYWQQNKSMMGMAASSTITTPSGALAIDMNGMTGTVKTVRPNNNKNTLYILGANDEMPEGLENSNVVKGGKAAQISIVDGQGFYTPTTVMAEKVTYTRTFKPGVWETVALPFAPQQWPAQSKVLSFAEESEDGKALFAETDVMERNVPYLVMVASDGEQTFSATDARIASSQNSSMIQATDDYRFIGQTLYTAVQNIFSLNDEGTAFEPVSSLRAAPFRAYFTTTAEIDKIEVPAGDLSGITQPFTHHPSSTTHHVYDLQGRRVQHPVRGLYIQGGKKVVVR